MKRIMAITANITTKDPTMLTAITIHGFGVSDDCATEVELASVDDGTPELGDV